MIKVLIVDDEKLERNLLRNCINWEHLDMEIVGEASNVGEALQLLESIYPDVIFTDINMPVIDGIQFIEIAAKKFPHVKFVIITGFDDFDYAQKSIKLGVSDFLLKPIDDEDVLKTASKLKEVIEQEREDQANFNQLRKQLYENLPYLIERFFYRLLKGGVDNKEIAEQLSFLGIQFKYKSYQVAAVEINHSENDEEHRLMHNIKVMHLVQSDFADVRYVQIFFDSANRIVILNNDENSDLFEKCELLKEHLNQELNCSVGIGLGGLKREPQEICGSYKEALDALAYRVAIGKNAVILYDNIQFSSKDNNTNTENLYSKLRLYLNSGLKSNAKEVIENLLKSINLQSASAVRKVQVIALEILMVCLTNSIETGSDGDEVYKSGTQLFNQIFSMETIPEIKEHLFDIVENTTQAIDRHQINKINTLIKEIKSYVDRNFSSHLLTLSNVAKEFYLNPSYLSRTFKKEVGINFIEYLTTVRMEKALSLLSENEDLKAFEIADSVGISDANYFGACFKKYTGVSISDYRKSSFRRSDPPKAKPV